MKKIATISFYFSYFLGFARVHFQYHCKASPNMHWVRVAGTPCSGYEPISQRQTIRPTGNLEFDIIQFSLHFCGIWAGAREPVKNKHANTVSSCKVHATPLQPAELGSKPQPSCVTSFRKFSRVHSK